MFEFLSISNYTKLMAKKRVRKRKVGEFSVGEEVLVYGGGVNETEFERGTEAVVDKVDLDENLYGCIFDDGHYDFYCAEQLRKYSKKAGASHI